MRKKITRMITIFAMVCVCFFGFTACGKSEDDKRKVSSLSIELLGTDYVLSNGEINTTFSDGKKIDLDSSDFKVTVTYNDNSTEVLSVKSSENANGYNFESNLPADKETTPAGEYKLTFSHSDLDKKYEVKVNVAKATIDVASLELEYSEYTYCGVDCEVSFANLPAGVSVSYLDNSNKAKDAGDYIVNATLSLTEEGLNNYNALTETQVSRNWKINKKPVEVPQAYFVEYTYDKTEKEATIDNIARFNERRITVNIKDDNSGESKTGTNAGEYNVTLEYSIAGDDAKNYELSKTSETVTWEIKKANYLVDISVSSEELIYNGLEQTVVLDTRNIDTSIVTLGNATGNKYKNAGIYEVTIPITVIDNNYQLTNIGGQETLEWEIKQKSINVYLSAYCISYGDDFRIAKDTLLGLIQKNNVLCESDIWSEQINDSDITASAWKYEQSGDFTEYRAGNDYGCAGKYTINIDGVSSNNYDITFNGTDKLVVQKKQLVVKANPISLTYGEDFEPGGATFTGLFSGESSSVLTGTLSFDTTYTTTSVPGAVCTVTPKGFDEEQTNYTITYESSAVTIKKAKLFIVTQSEKNSIQYGDDVSKLGAITLKLTGCKNEDESQILNSNYTISYGSYIDNTLSVYVPGSVYGSVKENYVIKANEDCLTEYAKLRYEVSINDGSFAVVKKQISLSINNFEISYGANVVEIIADAIENKSLIVLTNGNSLVDGDNLEDILDYGGITVANFYFVNNNVQYEPGEEKGSVGKYDAHFENVITFRLNNYEVTEIVTAEKLEVKQAKLQINVNGVTVSYGGAVSNSGYSVDGLAEGDDNILQDFVPVYYCYKNINNVKTEYKVGDDVGTYEITITNAPTLKNYQVVVTFGNVEVKPVELIVKANDSEISFGEEEKNNGVTITGFVNGDTETIFDGQSITYSYYKYVSGEKVKYEKAKYGVGLYVIEVSGYQSSNYYFTYKTGHMTVASSTIEKSKISWQGVTSTSGTDENDKFIWTSTAEATGGDISVNLNVNFGYEYSSAFKIVYSLNDAEYSQTVPTIKEAGEYTIYAKFEYETGFENIYTNGTVKFVLNIQLANPRTVSNAPIVESVSYSHLTLDSGEIKTVNLSLDEAEVTNTSEDLRTSVIEIKGKNEIITNFNVDVADGYTYKIFTDEDLTNELDLTNLNIKTSKIYIVIYDSNGEEFDLLEYDFVIDYSFHASGDDNRSLDNIETYYFTDEKFTLEFVSGNSDVKISSKLYVFENNKIKEIESLNLGEVVDAELVMEIGYGGNTYKYTKNVVAIYSLDFKEFIEEVENFGTLTFSGKKIEENSVEVSCELSECKVLMLSLRGGSYSISIESKKLINVGERYFLSFALIDTDKEDAGTFVIELIYIEE